MEMIPPQNQRKALEALLQTLQTEALMLPENILTIIPPRSLGYGRHREVFNIRTSPSFDPLAAAESAANITVRMILNSNRGARLVEHHARDSKYPGFGETVDRLVASTWKADRKEGLESEIQRVVDSVVLHGMMSLAANDRASNQVRAIAFLKLDELKDWLAGQIGKEEDEFQKAHFLYAIAQIERFQRNPEKATVPAPLEPPPGSPIGMDCGWEYF
jgi:hypothetical protein